MHIEDNVSLRSYNTFGIEVMAETFASFASVDELMELLKAVDEPPLIIGGGSNLLFLGNISKPVFKNGIKGIQLIKEDEAHYYIQVGAGENWHAFVMDCVEHNRAGIENLALIPGCVGASPMQNIGAYGVEIKDVFHSLQALHIATGKVQSFTLNDCKFGYRESVFKNELKDQFVIIDVVFRLTKTPVLHTGYGAIEAELKAMNVTTPGIASIAQAVINIRRSKLPDPKEIGNAGSFFKNPSVSKDKFQSLKLEFPAVVGYENPDGTIKLAAGWLIEQCGLKGYRLNDAGVHEKQALVLVNYSHASGNDIYELSEKVIKEVNEKFGVILEREVNIIP